MVNRARAIKSVRKRIRRLTQIFGSRPDAAFHIIDALHLVDAAQFLAASESLERLDEVAIALDENERIEVLECISSLRLLDDKIYQQTIDLEAAEGFIPPKDLEKAYQEKNDLEYSYTALVIARSFIIASGVVALTFSLWLFQEIPKHQVSKLVWYPLASIVVAAGLTLIYTGIKGDSKAVLNAISTLFR